MFQIVQYFFASSSSMKTAYLVILFALIISSVTSQCVYEAIVLNLPGEFETRQLSFHEINSQKQEAICFNFYERKVAVK